MHSPERLLLALMLALTLGCKADEAVDEPEPPSASETVEEGADEPAEAADPDELPAGTDAQRALLNEAKGYFLNEEWDRAQRVFEKLVTTGEISAPQVTAYVALGEIYREDGQTERALALYKELQEKAPRVPEVHFMTARALAESGETTRAMRGYEMTLKLQPDYLQAYVELGGLLARSGREDEAQKIFLRYERKIYEMAKILESPDAHPDDQEHVLEVFSFVQDDRANAAILKSLSNPSAQVREKAVTLAEEFRLGAARESLEEMAENDPELRVRLAAKQAVETLEDAPDDGSAPTFVDDPSKLPETESSSENSDE